MSGQTWTTTWKEVETGPDPLKCKIKIFSYHVEGLTMYTGLDLCLVSEYDVDLLCVIILTSKQT